MAKKKAGKTTNPKAQVKAPVKKGKIVQPKLTSSPKPGTPGNKGQVGTMVQVVPRTKPMPPGGVIVPGRPVDQTPAVTPTPTLPPIDPFLTPEEQAELDSSYARADEQLGDFDASARSTTTDAEYQKLLAREAAIQMANSTQNRAIARGTYFSSIKDAELFDIDKAKQRQIDYNDQVISDLQANRAALVHRLFGSGGFVDVAKKLAASRAATNAKNQEGARGPAPTTTPSPAAASPYGTPTNKGQPFAPQTVTRPPPTGYGTPTNKGQPFAPQTQARTQKAGAIIQPKAKSAPYGMGTIKPKRKK